VPAPGKQKKKFDFGGIVAFFTTILPKSPLFSNVFESRLKPALFRIRKSLYAYKSKLMLARHLGLF
jgi:hypothetical protein